MPEFKFNRTTKQFEGPNGEALTLLEFQKRVRDYQAERLRDTPVDRKAHRREQAERGRNNGTGWTRSGKR